MNMHSTIPQESDHAVAAGRRAFENNVELLSQRHYLSGFASAQSGVAAPLLLIGICGLYQPDWRPFAILILLHSLIMAGMFVVCTRLRRADDPTSHHLEWGIFTSLNFLSGGLWALLMLPVAPTLGTSISSTFVCCIIIVTVAIMSMLNATRRKCLAAFLTGVTILLLPQTIYYFEIIGPIPMLATLTLGPALWVLGIAVHRQDQSMIQTRLEKEQLALQLSQALERTKFLANHDSLTGLYNRRAFEEFSNSIKDEADREPICLILLDLDHFKLINDRFGHSAGDSVLKACAEVIRGNMRPTDILGRGDGAAARWGGEEFLLLLPNCPLAMAVQAAEKLREELVSLSNPDWPEGLEVSGSFGVSFWATDQDLHDCINAADQAMYRAKQMGRNRVEVSEHVATQNASSQQGVQIA